VRQAVAAWQREITTLPSGLDFDALTARAKRPERRLRSEQIERADRHIRTNKQQPATFLSGEWKRPIHEK